MEHESKDYTVTEGLVKGLEDLEITVDVLHYWYRPEYRVESRRLEETCCHSNSNERPSANTDVKNSLGVTKKLWNMEVMELPIVIYALGTIPNGLVKGLEDLEIRGRVETILTTVLRSARILRRVLETLSFLFFVLMAYKPLYVIYYQSPPSWRTVVVLFNPWLSSYLSQVYFSKSECNSAPRVRTCFLRFCNPSL